MLFIGAEVHADGAGRVHCLVESGAVAVYTGPRGFGFADPGQPMLDDAAPEGDSYVAGFRVNETGCVYMTYDLDNSDVYLEGLRVTVEGALVCEDADGTRVVNGNPVTDSGALAIHEH